MFKKFLTWRNALLLFVVTVVALVVNSQSPVIGVTNVNIPAGAAVTITPNAANIGAAGHAYCLQNYVCTTHSGAVDLLYASGFNGNTPFTLGGFTASTGYPVCTFSSMQYGTDSVIILFFESQPYTTATTVYVDGYGSASTHYVVYYVCYQ